MNGSRVLEHLLTRAASGAWTVLQSFNEAVPSAAAIRPRWAPAESSDGPSKPELGIPRTTTSLCPVCVRETRARISAGELDADALRREQPGQIPAQIVERDGCVVMQKHCTRHGDFEETISTDAAFTRRIERLFPGRDFDSSRDALHDHGPSSIRYLSLIHI